MREAITYADVLIQPQYSDIGSRNDIHIENFYLGEFRKPFISAPMDYVTGRWMASALADVNAYGVVSRFGDTHDFEGTFQRPYGLAVGVNKLQDTIEWLKVNPSHSICIDVAHGHHQKVFDAVEAFKKEFPDRYIIAGNVATRQGFRNLAQLGVNAVRVGIGPGSACSTRENTGVGVPQLTALMDIVDVKFRENFHQTDIIADGGIQNPGDIAKALAVGADAVMLGKMFAGHNECPGHIFASNLGFPATTKVRQPYRGQSMLGSNGARNAPEGVEGWVEDKGPVADTIEQLTNYLKSSFSYVGARTITEFRERAELIRVSPGTFRESETRL